MDPAQRFRKELAATAAGVARTLPDVPPDLVEDRLLTFDALLDHLDAEERREAAAWLGEAAGRCPDDERRTRVLAAAAAVAAGQPCARTPEGLTAAEAARAGTTRLEPPDPTRPLSVRDFRPGMLIRVLQSFRDFDGQEVVAGETLRFLERRYFHYDGGHTLQFEGKTIRLAEIVPANLPIIENHDGAYFALVPTGPS